MKEKGVRGALFEHAKGEDMVKQIICVVTILVAFSFFTSAIACEDEPTPKSPPPEERLVVTVSSEKDVEKALAKDYHVLNLLYKPKEEVFQSLIEKSSLLELNILVEIPAAYLACLEECESSSLSISLSHCDKFAPADLNPIIQNKSILALSILSGKLIDNSVCKALAKTGVLEMLVIESPLITSVGLNALFSMSTLKFLRLSGAKLQDSTIKGSSVKCAGLTELQLADDESSYGANLSKVLSGLEKLRYVFLTGTRSNKFQLSELLEAGSVQELGLSSNLTPVERTAILQHGSDLKMLVLFSEKDSEFTWVEVASITGIETLVLAGFTLNGENLDRMVTTRAPTKVSMEVLIWRDADNAEAATESEEKIGILRIVRNSVIAKEYADIYLSKK